MPRILRIINRLNLGGPTFNAALLSKHLAPDYETLLVAGTKQDSEESSSFIVQEQGLSFVEVPEMKREINPIQDWLAYQKLVKIIREFKPDIVHTHAAKSGALGRLAAIHEKVPVIVHTFHGHVFHSYFHPLQTKIFLGIERYLARHSDAIVAISDRQKQELGMVHTVCPEGKIRVIPLGFDLTRFKENTSEKRRTFREYYQLEDDEIAIGIIGRLVPIKNHTMFIDAAATILQATKRKVRFFIVGDGESRRKLLDYCQKLRLDFTFYPDEPKKSAITFTSWRRDVDVVLAGLDIVSLTSWNEGTPVSLIEAQAAGKPIVSTNVGGIENVVLPNETAQLVETGDTAGFAQKLSEIIESDSRRNEMSKSGWDFVKDRFHYTRLVRDMDLLYRELLRSNQR